MPSSDFYPIWSSANSEMKSRQGSYSDQLEPSSSCAAASECSTSPLPVWDMEDASMWDFPLPSHLTDASVPAPQPTHHHQHQQQQQEVEGGVPAWESSPAAWHYDDAQKLAEKLLNLNVSTENFSARDGERGCSSSSMNPRFKTEFCRNFREKGNCVYGDQCQFAHGKTELRQDVVRHSKYKTKLCQKFWIAGYCAYGARCNFIHQEEEVGEPKPYNPPVGARVGGLRPFTSTFQRKTSESSDSGVETGFSMPPPNLKLPSLRSLGSGMRPVRGGGEKRWSSTGCSISMATTATSSSAYPELNMNLPTENNRNLFGNIQKVKLGLDQAKSVVHHPEHNPIPTPDNSRSAI